MLSFRTRGNFVDFVHTDNTSLQVESVLMSLHNTSRAISWSFDSDPDTITFTINEVKYANIQISSIDFDGVVMNSQDDFETGIEDMFPGLAGGGGEVTIPATSYDNNADALAALGAGVLYKSTTLINGSPIILITV